MATVKLFNQNGVETGTVDLCDDVFGVEMNEHCVHMAVVAYLANQRQGTKSTLTRAEVRGGGKKPFAQKGTGRARQGSIRAPQYMGGGVVFAPKPRDYSVRLNKKVKRNAMKSALTSRVEDGKILVLESLNFDGIKTKNVIKLMDNFQLGKALVVVEENDKDLVLSARNLHNVKVATVNTLNVYDILKYETFMVTKAAAEKIQEVYI